MTAEGIPVINGVDVALRSLRNLMQYRSDSNIDPGTPHTSDPTVVTHWAQRLAEIEFLDEVTALQLMADFGLPAVSFQCADTIDQACNAAGACGYPLVMKTAVSGIAHKSDLNGVKVGIADRQQLQDEYYDLQQRLGSRVVVMPMVESGIEVSIGMKNDAQFGRWSLSPAVVFSSSYWLSEPLSWRQLTQCWPMP